MHVAHRASLVSHLVDSLRRELDAGDWAECLPSERELGERFQVSRPTLRKALAVLAREGRVRSQRGKGWLVERQRRQSYTSAESKSVGILCFVSLDCASPFTLLTIDKALEHLGMAGLKVHVHAGEQFVSQNYRQALTRLLQVSPRSAWVLVGSILKVQRWFHEQRVPFFDTSTMRGTLDFPGVVVDVQHVYRDAIATLRRRGHRRITLLVPRHGHYDLATKGGVMAGEPMAPGEDTQADSSVRIIFHSGTRDSVHRAIAAIRGLRAPPTALIVARPQHTLAAVTYLLRCGVRVPQDISLICLGHETFLDQITPTIAHYTFDRNVFVRRLCRMLVPWATTGYWSPAEGRLAMHYRDGESVGSL